MEIDYAVDELLFAVLFLAVAAIPLRRGARWAWWCCWLIVVPEATLAVLFGAHDSANMAVASALAFITVLALLVMGPGSARSVQSHGTAR
jgi:hypothetical protein